MTFRSIGLFNIFLFLIVVILHAHPWYMLMLTAAQLIYVPFTLHLILRHESERSWFSTVAPYFAIPSSMAVAILQITDQTIWDPILAAVYFAFTILVALFGLTRFLKRGFEHFEQFLIDMGCMYLAIGGVWFLASVSGVDTGFSTIITWLTGIHFHYAAFILLVFTGLLGRIIQPHSRFYLLTGWLAIVAPIVVALGITFSKVLELVSVLVYMMAIGGFIVLSFKAVFHTFVQKVLIRISFGALGVTIIFSFGYALTRLAVPLHVDIDFMLCFHGVMNTGLFALIGLIGWYTSIPAPLSGRGPFPVSQIRGAGGSIGEHILHDIQGEHAYDGLVDHLDRYVPSGSLAPTIVDFYEHTNDYRLFAEVKWHTWFQPFAFVYRWVSRRVQQIHLPFSRQRVEMTGEIVPIQDHIDGRNRTRAWVRKINGETVFVALYASHQAHGRTFMNISLPLPFSAMVGILELQYSGNDMILTSRRKAGENSDAGIYLAMKNQVPKLPLEERFHIREVEEGVLQATHRMWICSIPFLTIDYMIYHEPKDKS